MSKWSKIEEELKNLKKNHLYRTIKIIESPQSSHILYKGKDILMLSSNSYLDFCNDMKIKQSIIASLEKYGIGSGGSRLTTGTTPAHIELEKLLSTFTGRQSSLIFNSGFSANTGAITALCKENDVIFSDEQNHASIIDGCRQSKAEVIIYKHNDMHDLEKKVKSKQGKHGIIVSDGVFSMSGDIVKLPELIKIANNYGFISMIDEAHSIGVIGKHGKGCEDYYQMYGCIDVLMGTLSKSFGSEGGFISGSNNLIEYLKNKSRNFIFSTAISPLSVVAAKCSIECFINQPNCIKSLKENIKWFCKCLTENGIPTESQTAIIPIKIGNEKQATHASQILLNRGYFISAIRYPTVKKGEAILRATIMSTHTKKELSKAAQEISNVILKIKSQNI